MGSLLRHARVAASVHWVVAVLFECRIVGSVGVGVVELCVSAWLAGQWLAQQFVFDAVHALL